ncbi:MAG TPA: phage major capsid protein [Candidatus Angelobacter sp.]|jgi:HK97 family phage major capsid protein|nr:phage major capsid protein [Candidatus Angelobacter sp.]
MRKRRFFNGAGEKRKFYNNMRHFGGTRNISLTFLGFAPMLGPLAVLMIIMAGLVMLLGGIGHTGEFARVITHGKHGFAHAATYGAVAMGLAAAAVPDFKGIQSLEQKRADLVKANGLLLDKQEAEDRDLTPAEEKTYSENLAQIKSLSARIGRIEAQRENEKSLGRKPVQSVNNPGNASAVEVLDGPKFKSFGEQLKAVATFEKSRGFNKDPRLIAVGSEEHKKLAAATGLNEAIPAEGGFLVQTDFVPGLLQKTYNSGLILPLVNRIEVSSESNRVVINGIDEQSRANGSRFGGVQAFWANEADTITATKPKFRRVELILNKLTAAYFATDELLADATALESVVSDVVPQEFAFRIEDAIFNGVGNGQPNGFLNAPSLIVVAKEVAQPTLTVVAQNIMKMWSRCWNRSRLNAVWLIDQSIEPQLFQMTLPSAAGISVPIYLPPGGLSGSPYGSLFGRPVISTEYNAAITNQGDIVLADLSQYKLADKGGIQAASSMHVNFLKDEMCFRFTQRLDGQVLWNTALTPKNGGPTLSPFVTLQAR